MSGHKYQQTPTMVLKGKWLEQAGFTVGEYIFLSFEDHDLYRLYFVEGFSQDEIAEIKGVPQNTISRKIRRITKRLTEMYRKEI